MQLEQLSAQQLSLLKEAGRELIDNSFILNIVGKANTIEGGSDAYVAFQPNQIG